MTLTRISCNLILKLYLQQPLFLTISKHNIQFVTPKSKNKKLQGDAPQTRKNYRCSGFMKNSVLQSSIWIASAGDQLTFSLRRFSYWPSLWDGYPEISAHLKCNNKASLVEAKYHTCIATIQEPIIRCEQVPCALSWRFHGPVYF